MELIHHQMPANFTICDMSDFHLGSPNCAEDTLQEVIEQIASTKDCYVIFKGDAIEAILPDDKRYLHSAVRDGLQSPKAQADRVIELFSPIKDRLLGWGIGNHELKLWNTMDFGKYIADALETPYGAYNFKIAFYDDKDNLMFKTYHTHGMGAITSHAKCDIQYEATRKSALKSRMVRSGHGDCIYMSRGHDHQLIVVEPTVHNKLFLTDDGEGIHQHYHTASAQNVSFIPPESRWYATTGSFRKLYSKPGLGTIDYGEVVGYAPSELGFALVTVEGKQIVDIRKVVA